MQIRNDYHSFSGRQYQDSHTHHITKCLHEEKHRQHEAAAAGIKQRAEDAGKGQKTEQDVVFQHGISTEKKDRESRKGFGTIRALWDSMGNEKKEETAQTHLADRRVFFNHGIDAASSAIRQRLPHWMINKWESVREKVRVGVKSALKRFGKDKDAFSALSDPKGQFAGRKESGEEYHEKAGVGTRRKKPDIMTAALADTHLMDSYSKTGEYCRLNENLTYQKNRALENQGPPLNSE